MLRLIILAIVAWIVYRLLKLFFPQFFGRKPEVHGRGTRQGDWGTKRKEKEENISDADFTEIE